MCQKDPSTSLGMTLRKWRFPNISVVRCVKQTHFPHTVISSKVEKYSSHSTFSCSFRKRFPLFRYHTYDIIPSCKKDPSTSLGMTLRKWRFPNISFIRDVGYPSPHTVISSKVEKYSSHSTFSCSFRKRFPLFRYHTYDIIPFCKKDPSTSLGMTLRKWRFPNISFIRDVGYPSPIPYP